MKKLGYCQDVFSLLDYFFMLAAAYDNSKICFATTWKSHSYPIGIAESALSHTHKTALLAKECFAKIWELHRYPIGLAESSIKILNTYIAKPIIVAGSMTKEYFVKHYDEVIIHVIAWSILFCLCGVLSTRNLSGLSTITKPMFIGVGPGFGIGLLAGVVRANTGFQFNPQKGGFAEKVVRASENIFLRAASGATFILVAGTIPIPLAALTGVFLGYMLVQHIIDFPERAPSNHSRLKALEANTGKLADVIRSTKTIEDKVAELQVLLDEQTENYHVLANLLHSLGNVLKPIPPAYNPERIQA